MAFDLNSISTGCGQRPPRIVVLGTPFIGKSEFAAGADRSIFLPIRGEEGIDCINVPQFPTCNELQDVLDCFTTLYGSDKFGTVVIDSASTLEPLIWQSACARCPHKSGAFPKSIEELGGGFQRGYVESLTEWRIITDALDTLRAEKNMASIIIGHVKVKRFDDPCGKSYDQWQFDLHEKAANLLYKWCDIVLFCGKKTAVTAEDVGFNKEVKKGIDTSGGMRYIYTQDRPSHPGGGRGVYGRLPYEIPLSWTAFQDAVALQLAKEAAEVS